MKQKIFFLAFLFAIIGPFSLLAGTPHILSGTVKYSDNTSPVSVNFQAYVVGRSSEVLTQSSASCGYSAGSYYVQCGSFPTNWTAGEQIAITITDNLGFSGSGTVTLTNNPNDNLNLVIPHPDISVSPTSLSFGEIIIGSSSSKSVTVSNSGSVTLNVTSSQITGTDASMFQILGGVNAFSLAPGGSKEVSIQFQPGSSGGKSAAIQFVSNDPDEGTLSLSLTGTGVAQPDISVSPASKDFGSVILGQTGQQVFSISNTGSASLEVSSITLTGGQSNQFSIISGGGAFSLVAGASRDLTVRFTPTSTGNKSTTLSIVSNDPDETPLNIELSGTGVGVPDIHSAQTGHAYGDVYLFSSSVYTFQIQNTGTGDLQVTSTALGGACPDQFAIQSGGDAFTLAPGGSHNISVAFLPTFLGYSSAVLNIQSDDPDENPYQLSLSGNCIEIPEPHISISPADFTYEPVLVGGDKSQIFVVTNTGSADLHLSGIALSGSDASQFAIQSGSSDTTLAPGDTRNIVVQFKPLSVGAKSASLSITSDDPDQALSTIQLSGQGTMAAISVSPSVYDFGGGLYDHTADKSFLIKNEGTATLTISSIAFSPTSSDDFLIPNNPAPFSLAPGESRYFTVLFTPMSLETHQAEIIIVHNIPDQDPSTITITGQGVVGDIEVDPLSLNFGFVQVDSVLVKELTVSNAGTAVLHVTGAAITGTNASSFAYLSASSFSIEPGENQQVEIQFAPQEIGAQSAQLTLQSDDPDEGEITISLSGNDESPDILLSRLDLDFSDVIVNTSDTLLLTITNEGQADLKVFNCQITGDDDSLFSCISSPTFILHASESMPLSVRFSPVDTGSFSAVLEIVSNDPDETSLSVSLKGNSTPDDTLAPEIVYLFPLDSLSNVPVNSSIQFLIDDAGYGLDLSSLNLSVSQNPVIVGGVEQTQGTVTFTDTDQGLHVIYRPISKLSKNSDIQIDLSCQDLAPSKNVYSGQFHFQTGEVEGISLSTFKADQNGGIFEDTETGLVLNIPENALNAPVDLQMFLTPFFVDMPDTAVAVGWHYLLAPMGLSFYETVIIEMPYSETDLEEASVGYPSNLPLYSYNPISQSIEKKVIVDSSNHHVYFYTDTACAFTFAKETHHTAVASVSEIPQAFELEQNYPNPFNPVTNISFKVKTPCRVQMDLFDIQGNKVMQLVDGEHQAGSFTYVLDAANLPTGVYVYTIKMRDYTSRKKLLLLK